MSVLSSEPYLCPLELPSWSYEEALSCLHEAERFGMKPVLETVVEMLDELARPDSYYRIVQIAGTNGKTSSSRYTAALLIAEGYKTALYTSPDLCDITERFEIDQQLISHEDFAYGMAAAFCAAQVVNSRRLAFGENPYDITRFDLLTVAALVIFARAGVEWAVLEVGLGGRWDATSASDPEVVGISGIGLDHTRILGDTLEKIAAEKAAIIKPGRRVVLGVGTTRPQSVQEVFLERCQDCGCTPQLVKAKRPSDVAGILNEGEELLHGELATTSFSVQKHPQFLGDNLVFSVESPRASYEGMSIKQPLYQAANCAFAIALAEEAHQAPLSQASVTSALSSCKIPGRFELLSKDQESLVMIDACHNPQSLKAFLASLSELEVLGDAEHKPALLCAILADKDYKSMIASLAASFDRIFCTQTKSPRALAASELAQGFEAEGASVEQLFESVDEAVSYLRAQKIPFIGLGSITLAGELRALYA